MRTKRISVGPLQTNCYIIEDETPNGRFCAVVDPGDDPKTIEENLPRNLTHIILTHAHFDHVGALETVHKAHPTALFAVGEHEPLDSVYTFYSHPDLIIPPIDVRLVDGSTIGPFTVIHTPGHTKGSICLYSAKDGLLLSGDTLFEGCYGRTDLGGSMSDMQTSLARLAELPPETKVLPGHGAPTTIGREFNHSIS